MAGGEVYSVDSVSQSTPVLNPDSNTYQIIMTLVFNFFKTSGNVYGGGHFTIVK